MGVQGARIPNAHQHQHSPCVSAIFIPTIAQLAVHFQGVTHSREISYMSRPKHCVSLSITFAHRRRVQYSELLRESCITSLLSCKMHYHDLPKRFFDYAP
jgi:hypothetical protein